MGRLASALIALVWIGGSTAMAEVREIGWADLIPQSAPLADPLQGADLTIRQDLARLARVRADVAQGFLAEDSDAVAEADALVAQRLAEGIDLRALEKTIADFDAEIARQSAAINPALDGKIIRMPGYALPLEFAADGATDLFLVPYVGACIHVPPPPPNQIVSTRLDDPVMLDGLFAPVWVTGRMKVDVSSRALSFVDGSADVSYGYSLTEVRIEPYE